MYAFLEFSSDLVDCNYHLLDALINVYAFLEFSSDLVDCNYHLLDAQNVLICPLEVIESVCVLTHFS
jgi:hypothetical protein